MPADLPRVEPTDPLTHDGAHQPAADGGSFGLLFAILTLVGLIFGLLAVAAAGGGGTALMVVAVAVMLAGGGLILALIARLLDSQ